MKRITALICAIAMLTVLLLGSMVFADTSEYYMHGTNNVTENDSYDMIVRANSEYNSNHAPYKAFDGKMGGGWQSATTGTSWIAWQYTQSKCIESISVSMSEHNIETAFFTFFYSYDGLTYLTAGTTRYSTKTSGEYTVTIEASKLLSAKYWKLQIAQSGSNIGWMGYAEKVAEIAPAFSEAPLDDETDILLNSPAGSFVSESAAHFVTGSDAEGGLTHLILTGVQRMVCPTEYATTHSLWIRASYTFERDGTQAYSGSTLVSAAYSTIAVEEDGGRIYKATDLGGNEGDYVTGIILRDVPSNVAVDVTFAYILRDKNYMPDEEQTGTVFEELIGECLALTAKGNIGTQLINNSGMSGLWSSNHLHAAFNGAQKPAYITENMYSVTEKDGVIILDAGKLESLGNMFVWNYGDSSDYGSCVKDMSVYYSENDIDYNLLGRFTIAQTDASDAAIYGGFMASNIAVTGLPIDFCGATARYIKLVMHSNYGGSKYGLSEVRIFRHKTRPRSGEQVFGNSFTPRTDSDAENVANGSGMSKLTGNVYSAEIADNIRSHMWKSDTTAALSLLVLDLDGNYPLSKLKIWNFNDPSDLDSGIRQVDIYYTTGEACQTITSQTEQDYYDFSKGSWIKLGTYTLSKGTGANSLAASLEIDLSNIHAQHIRISPLSNYGGTSTGFGLSEIRVYADSGFAVEPARLWTGILNTSGSFSYHGNNSSDPFAKRNSGSGWIGSDGVFSTSLSDNQLQGSLNENSLTLFTFQDSFVGNMGNYRSFSLSQGYAANNNGFNLGMKNMAYMFLKGNKPDVRNVQFYTALNNNLSSSHPLQNILPGSYWIGDSTVIDGKVYTAANGFSGLSWTGRDIYVQEITVNGINMNKVAQTVATDVDKEANNNGKFEPLYEEGGYIYQYGREDGKMIVRRTTEQEYTTYSGWKYYDGSNWVNDMSACAAISSESPGNEFNVTYMQTGAFAGKYIAVYTIGSIWGTVTCMLSDSITGPFVTLDDYCGVKSLYFSTERYDMGMNAYKSSSDYYVTWNYNAKSQPAISAENELLITYHFGLHDDRVASWGYFSAVGKEYEQATFIKLITLE